MRYIRRKLIADRNKKTIEMIEETPVPSIFLKSNYKNVEVYKE
jgi:hypothetical protein